MHIPLLQPDDGENHLRRAEITHKHANQIAALGIARTFQNLELFGELSVLENVLLGTYSHATTNWRRILSAANAETREFAEDLLRRVGLIEYRHHLANSLDFGRQKMLELARALAIKPKLLLLDEPAAGLRNREINTLDTLLSELAARDGMTILLVDQNVKLALSVSSYAYILENGEVVLEGKSSDLKNDEGIQRAYLGA